MILKELYVDALFGVIAKQVQEEIYVLKENLEATLIAAAIEGIAKLTTRGYISPSI